MSVLIVYAYARFFFTNPLFYSEGYTFIGDESRSTSLNKTEVTKMSVDMSGWLAKRRAADAEE